MEYWNANVQGIRQVFDIKRYFIIHETRANSAECELCRTKQIITQPQGLLPGIFSSDPNPLRQRINRFSAEMFRISGKAVSPS